MATYMLLQRQRKLKNYTYAFIADCIQCDAKTLRNYFNRTTKGGKYLTRLLELLDISVKEWNNALDEDEKEKEAQKL